MEIRTGTVTFGRARDTGPRTQLTTFNFTKPVKQAVAGLSGSSFGFSPRDDHHLGLVNLRLVTTIDDDVVTVESTFGVRDWSGEFDDDYEGTIQFVLLAELDDAPITPSNLSITGVEHNQAIQFFRSRLDPATARPDNAIALIAGKNTILRVYVDTQSDPTRPTVALIDGVLEIRPAGSTAWNPIPALNPGITPKADNNIDRRNANDTLNFLIPGPFCTGELECRVRAYDAAHPDQPGYTSARRQETLSFTRTNPLRVRGVAVRFTRTTPPVPAPSMASLTSLLSFTRKAYPVSDLVITGLDVIDFGGNLADTSGGGCGSGWNGLLDRLREMQGDSDDVYFGLLPAGVPAGGALGCGGGDGRVAAAITTAFGATAAQEIAHAFGREHACGDKPLDPNYPTYDAFPMASIGEVGMDDLGNAKDPAATLDFMAQAKCSTNRWVSPYIYEGLRASFPVAGPSLDVEFSRRGEAEQPRGGEEERPLSSEYLFLNFSIYRGGRVRIAPSFHYPASPSVKEGRATPYGVELRDRHDKPLQAQRIELTDPHRTLDSPTLDFFKPIPFPLDTARVVVTCADDGCSQRELASVDVPSEPPRVQILEPEKPRRLEGRVHIRWHASHEDGDKCLWYLVRYSNDDGRTWRALAPRLRETEFTVDFDRLPGGDDCRLQVLATEGIRTGQATTDAFDVPPRPRDVIISAPSEDVAADEPVILVGEAFSPDYGAASPSELHWYSDLEGDLGPGREIRRVLQPGLHQVTLQAPDGRGGQTAGSIQIRVNPPSAGKHTSRTHPDHSSTDHDAEG